MGVVFYEKQPARPWWWQLALETEITLTIVRFRATRRGAWRAVLLSDIRGAELIRVRQWMWPVGYKLGFDGAEAYITMSGTGVRFTLNDGKTLFLSSRDPQALLGSIQKQRTAIFERCACDAHH